MELVICFEYISFSFFKDFLSPPIQIGFNIFNTTVIKGKFFTLSSTL